MQISFNKSIHCLGDADEDFRADAVAVSLLPVGLMAGRRLASASQIYQLATERLAVLRGNQLSLVDHIANPQGRQFNDAIGHSGDGGVCPQPYDPEHR